MRRSRNFRRNVPLDGLRFFHYHIMQMDDCKNHDCKKIDRSVGCAFGRWLFAFV